MNEVTPIDGGFAATDQATNDGSTENAGATPGPGLTAKSTETKDRGKRDPRRQEVAKVAVDDASETYQALAVDALNGKDDARDALAIAYTGMTYKELSADPEQKKAFDSVLVSLSESATTPSVRFVDAGDLNAGTSQTLLPEGVQGAYVPGKNGEPGVILISKDVKDPAEIRSVIFEEMGEALAQDAEDRGLKLGEGDVGARLQLVAFGEDLDMDSDLFTPASSDTTQILFEGDLIEVEARQAGTVSPTVTADVQAFIQKFSPGATSANFSMTRAEFRAAVDFPPGTEPTDAFLDSYTGAAGANTANGNINGSVLEAMFQDGVIYTSDSAPGTFFGDVSKISSDTLRDGVLTLVGDGSTPIEKVRVTGKDLQGALTTMFGTVEWDVPTEEQFNAIVAAYSGNGTNTVGYLGLEKVFSENALTLSTNVKMDGTYYYVDITASDRFPITGGVDDTAYVEPDIAPDSQPTAAGRFMAKFGTPAGKGAGLQESYVTFEDFRQATQEAGVWATPDQVLALYADTVKNQPVGQAGEVLSYTAIKDMFKDGFLAESGSKGAYTYTAERDLIGTERLVDFVFKPRFGVGSSLTGADILAALTELFPGGTKPPVAEFNKLVATYTNKPGGGLSKEQFAAVLEDGALTISRKKDTDAVVITIDTTAKPDVAVKDPTTAAEFIEKYGETATSDGTGPNTRISFETLKSADGPVDWNGREPTISFLNAYTSSKDREDRPGQDGYLVQQDIQAMMDDGVLALNPDNGGPHGHIENISAATLASALIRETDYLQDALELGAEPWKYEGDLAKGTTFYEPVKTLLENILSSVLPDGRAKTPTIDAGQLDDLLAQFGSRKTADGPAFVTEAQLTQALLSDGFNISVVPEAGAGASLSVKLKLNPETDRVFGPKPGPGATTTQNQLYDQLTAAELSEKTGIEFEHAKILISIYGENAPGTSTKTFITKQTYDDLLSPTQTLTPEATTLPPVLTIDPKTFKHTIHWDNIKGSDIASAVAGFYGNRTNLQALEIIDGLEALFGNVDMSAADMQILKDRYGSESGQNFLALALDKNEIKLTPSKPDQGSAGEITASIDKSALASEGSIESIFQYDADDSGYLEKDEFFKMFEERGASPNNGNLTEEFFEILGAAYGADSARRGENPYGRGKQTTDTSIRFSRENIKEMLTDGSLRWGYNSTSSQAEKGFVADLSFVPLERLSDAAFGSATSITVDDWLGGLMHITGDYNPFGGKSLAREIYSSVLATSTKDGVAYISKDDARKAMADGVFGITPANDRTHLRFLPALEALLANRPGEVFDRYSGGDGKMTYVELKEFFQEMLGLNEAEALAAASRVQTTFRSPGAWDLSRQDFIEFVKAGSAPTTTSGVTKASITFDLDIALAAQGAGTDIDIAPSPEANFDTTGYTFDSETGLFVNNETGQTVNADGVLVDPETGVAIPDSRGRPQQIETPIAPIPPERAESSGLDPAEFTPFDGPDGQYFRETVSNSTPYDALNVQLESGEGSISEQAIANIFLDYKNARPGSTKRKHYVIMQIESMLQRGLTAEDIGNELTKSNLSGDELLEKVFDPEAFAQLKKDVENDAAHQAQFHEQYVQEVDKLFSQNFELTSDGILAERPKGSGVGNITFSALLEKVGQGILNESDNFLVNATDFQKTALFHAGSLINTFLAGKNDALVVAVGEKLQAMVAATGEVPEPSSVGADGITVDLDGVDPVALDYMAWTSANDAFSVMGARGITRFLAALRERGHQIIEVYSDFKRLGSKQFFGKYRSILNWNAGEYADLAREFKTFSFSSVVATSIGVVSLALRYGGLDPQALKRLKEGDPQEVLGFSKVMGHMSGHYLQAAPDVAVSFRLLHKGETFAEADIRKGLEILARPEMTEQPTTSGTADKFYNAATGPITGDAFQSRQTVLQEFGWDDARTFTPEEWARAGLDRDTVADSLVKWYKDKDNQTFVEKYGTAQDVKQAIFTQVVLKDPNYLDVFVANTIMRKHFPADSHLALEDGVVPQRPIGEISEGTVQLPDTLAGATSVDEWVDFLVKNGMSKSAASGVVYDLVNINNFVFAEAKELQKVDPNLSIADAAKEVREKYLGKIGDAAEGLSDTSAVNERQTLLTRAWDAPVENKLFKGETHIAPSSVMKTSTGREVQSVHNTLFVTDSVPVRFAPGDAPRLNFSDLPEFGDGGIPRANFAARAPRSGATKFLKGVKAAGHVLEWGGDAFGLAASIWDLTQANNAYDKSTASVGIVSSIAGLAAMVAAGSAGTLTIPFALIAGACGVAQLIMSFVKPQETPGEAFARTLVSDFSEFSELIRPGGEDFLIEWYNKEKQEEKDADIDEPNFF